MLKRGPGLCLYLFHKMRYGCLVEAFLAVEVVGDAILTPASDAIIRVVAASYPCFPKTSTAASRSRSLDLGVVVDACLAINRFLSQMSQ
jgi:hypothetical protein